MKSFGLIGTSLSHSFSKKHFDEKFKNEGLKDCLYQNFKLKNCCDLKPLIENNISLIGLNVTMILTK